MMHLADGILSIPVLAAGTALGAAGVAVGLRKLNAEELPKAALVTTTFFVASLIHIPIGPTQLHLVLNGLAGLLLGWMVFPALLVALLLQAVMFGYGGLSVLGVNTLIMALPGLCAHLALAPRVRGGRSRGFAIGALAGGIGIAGAAAILIGFLALSGDRYRNLHVVIATFNIPLLIVEALVSGSMMAFLVRLRPEIFAPRNAS